MKRIPQRARKTGIPAPRPTPRGMLKLSPDPLPLFEAFTFEPAAPAALAVDEVEVGMRVDSLPVDVMVVRGVDLVVLVEVAAVIWKTRLLV